MEYPKNLIDFLEDICRLFEREQVNFCVAGGFAASIWGTPRATSDIDIVLGIEDENRNTIVELLDHHFDLVQSHDDDMVFSDLHIWRHIIKAGDDNRELFILDTLIANTDYLKRVITRRRTIHFHNIKLPVVSKEDLIILKAIAFRDIDKHDIRNILKSKTPTDWDYLAENFRALQLDWDFIMDCRQ